MNLIDTLKQARECLRGVLSGDYSGNAAEAITALSQVIEQMEKRGPVAWRWRRNYMDGSYTDGVERQKSIAENRCAGCDLFEITPLYDLSELEK